MTEEKITELIKENAYEIAVNIKVCEELKKEKGTEGRSQEILEAVAYESILRQIFGKEKA